MTDIAKWTDASKDHQRSLNKAGGCLAMPRPLNCQDCFSVPLRERKASDLLVRIHSDLLQRLKPSDAAEVARLRQL